MYSQRTGGGGSDGGGGGGGKQYNLPHGLFFMGTSNIVPIYITTAETSHLERMSLSGG